MDNFNTNLLFLLTCLGIGMGKLTVLTVTKSITFFNIIDNSIKVLLVGFSSGIIGGNVNQIYIYLYNNLAEQLINYLSSYIFIPTMVYSLYLLYVCILCITNKKKDGTSKILKLNSHSIDENNDYEKKFWENKWESTNINLPLY